MDVCYVKGVGPAKQKKLAKLGIFTREDLLTAYPREYLDLSRPLSVASAPFDQKCCVRVTITGQAVERPIPGGRKLFTLWGKDDSANLRILFFNTGYTAQSLKSGETYLLYGKMGGTMTQREMVSPLVYPGSATGLHPVYPLTAGISNKMMSNMVKSAMASAQEEWEDPIPLWMQEKFQLPTYRQAVEQVHFPTDEAAMKAARSRLIFEELLILQLGMHHLKNPSRGVSQVNIQRDHTPEFWSSLPFTPTAAQVRVGEEALADMGKGVPMNRLVQGDVGSGKTAIAAALCHTVAKNGWQCAVMAPTELLARQHYDTFTKLLAPFGVRVGLLTGSAKAGERKAFLEGLASGDIQVAIGTHALLEDTVQFHGLGLVVTDEQHRFGVAQRGRLAAKGDAPHLLVMSATPIPRTLAMMIYGDLDLSVVDERPGTRQKVGTWAVDSSYRPRIYNYMRKYVEKGQQVYVVCPLVEENEEQPSGLLSAQTHAANLTREFPDLKVGLLHGKMKPAEKEQVMEQFARGHIDILVATTVVEVGVDVPNANLMVIENAERFGLSQLHQLRGRVGRGDQPADCILVSDHQGEQTARRLKVLCQTDDGFQIADEDLKLRGPGDFFGSRQHGLPPLKLADLLTDTTELQAAAWGVKWLLEQDPSLSLPQHAGLKQRVEGMCRRMVLA